MPSHLSSISKRLLHENLVFSGSAHSIDVLAFRQSPVSGKPKPRINYSKRGPFGPDSASSSPHSPIGPSSYPRSTYRLLSKAYSTANLNKSNVTHEFSKARKNASLVLRLQGCRLYTCGILSANQFDDSGSPWRITRRPVTPVTGPIEKIASRSFGDVTETNHHSDEAPRTSGMLIDAKLHLESARKHLKEGDLSTAMELIEKSTTMSREITDSAYFQITCWRALNSVGGDNQPYQYSADIMERLQKLDVRLGIPIYNTLILQAIRAEDVGTAWEIYNLIRANGKNPDRCTYGILQKLCRVTQDKQAYRQLRAHVVRAPPESFSIVNAYEEVYGFHLFEARYEYENLLPVYLKYFDPRPLEVLGIFPNGGRSLLNDQPFSQPFTPNRHVVNIMIMAFLRTYPSAKEISRLYRNFQEALRVGDRSILPLLWSTTTYHCFLKGLSGHPWEFGIVSTRNPPTELAPPTELHWHNVLEAMTNPPDHIMDEVTGERPPILEPTIQTWTIVLQGYAKAGKILETEAIMQSLEDRGLQPNVVTFNVLIKHFSRRSYVQHVAKLLRRMKEKKIAADEHTARALSQMRNKRALARATDVWADSDAVGEEDKEEGEKDKDEGYEDIWDHEDSDLLNSKDFY